jgi:hypothetical protein
LDRGQFSRGEYFQATETAAEVAVMATVVYTNPETGYRAWDVPVWCTYYPSVGLQFLSTCQPPTPAQVAETTLSNMGAAAAANPSVAQQIQTISQGSPTDPFYCQADPQGCADYRNWLANPALATALGPSAAGTVASVSEFLNPANPSSPLNLNNVLLFGGAALLILFLVRR